MLNGEQKWNRNKAGLSQGMKGIHVFKDLQAGIPTCNSSWGSLSHPWVTSNAGDILYLPELLLEVAGRDSLGCTAVKY